MLLFTLVIIYSMQALTPGITGALNLIQPKGPTVIMTPGSYFRTRLAELRILTGREDLAG